MKKMIVLIFVFCISIFGQSKEVETNRVKFDPSRNPFDDLKTATGNALENSRRIILDVGGEWCIWCHRLDAFIENDEEIKNYLNENFITVKVNYSPENKNEKFLEQYPKIKGYPHIFVLEKDGTFLHSQDTALLEKDKSYDKDKIMDFLKTWLINK